MGGESECLVGKLCRTQTITDGLNKGVGKEVYTCNGHSGERERQM